MLSVFAAQMVIMGATWCSGARHGVFRHPGLLWSDVIHFYLSLVYSFCTTVVRTSLPLPPPLTGDSYVLTMRIFFSPRGKSWRDKRSWCPPYWYCFNTTVPQALMRPVDRDEKQIMICILFGLFICFVYFTKDLLKKTQIKLQCNRTILSIHCTLFV